MRTCETPGCGANIDHLHINSRYCKPCRKQRDKDASKRNNQIAIEKRRAKMQMVPCRMCGDLIPYRNHYCATCKPLSVEATRQKTLAKQREKKKRQKPAPTPPPPITAAEIHVRSLAKMGLRVIPGASPAGECRRLTGAEFEAVAAGMR